MKIKTELLQKMVAKAIQGSSNDKLFPITSLIGITVDTENDKTYLSLTTTDGSYIFKVTNIIDTAEDFYTIVNAEQFSKLVGKTTKEYIELVNENNYLLFNGNGSYKLDIAINEDGDMIQFKQIPPIDEENMKKFDINLVDLQDGLKISRASTLKDTTSDLKFLLGYYIADNIITTDTKLACKLSKSIISEPILITSELAELLLLINLDLDDKLVLYKLDNQLIFSSNHYSIYSVELDGKDIYTNNIVKAINDLTNLEYTNEVCVDKSELLDILGRMELFVGDFGQTSIYLRFLKEQNVLQVQSLKSNAIEDLSITEGTILEDYECLVDIEMLKNQLQSLNSEKVKIQFGNQKSIQLKEDKITLVISLQDK